jgi:hypothetical protein
MIRILCSLALLICCITSQAQNQVQDSSLFTPHVDIHFGYHGAGGDLADRFRDNLALGIGFHIKSKTNWYYGVKGTYIFGNRVLEPGLMQNLFTDQGEILDDQGVPSIVSAQERGYHLSLNGGRLFPIIGKNKNSGLLIYGGIGFLQHKIRLEHQESTIAQLEGEYLKGYDRLTNGFAANQFLGYFNMSNSRVVNFYIGLEAIEGWTEGRRAINFDTGTIDNEPRFDMLLGLRFGWVLHLYERAANEFYFD